MSRRGLAALLAAAGLLAACSSEPLTRGTEPGPAATTDPATDAATAPSGEASDDSSEATTPAFAQDLTNLGGSRDRPLSIGGKVRVGDEWDVRLIGYDPDATDEVLAFNEANPAPPDGEVFALARLEATYVGPADRANAFLELEWALVDDAGELHTDADCGVLPDDLASQDGVPQGQAANGTICFSVPRDLLDQVVLHVAPLLGPEPTRRWWTAPASGAGKVL